ncbi:UDP-N-acetylmuramate dehydrogenase [Anaerovorax odorimutans]|uniref:UDP-N-acetylenolpyruvoylglucosamine reductase n=1 Tax=Anaerovorax odorimutans TaxID=109327 RepID=A0ABT1RQ05_9FIRM|nr:UDP-N-acetylmuramate dehydrogenase [Anaerovorax odorimutans]
MAFLKGRLTERLGEKAVLENCDMSRFTSFRTGGKADFLILPENEEELKFTLSLLAETDMPYMVMGNGSNILVKDGGFRGAIIKLGDAFGQIEIHGEILTAGCGALMSSVARAALDAELTGFEFASGIPGSLGGAVFMNAGAYGGEMAGIIREARIIKKDGSGEYTLSCEELELGYRHSILHNTGDVAVNVTLELAKGDKETIGAEMKELAARRNEKQPVSLPSAGSFFKRPTGYFAGKLIQDAGLKGLSVGGAQVSPLHSGFIVNTGGATATDIIRLMEIVQASVLDKFGVKLEPEVRIIGE